MSNCRRLSTTPAETGACFPTALRVIFGLLVGGVVLAQAVAAADAPPLTDLGGSLKAVAQHVGKPAWQPLLNYTADLHQRSLHPAEPPFAFEWEEIGPGYGYGPAFGHWDIVHEILDAVSANRPHVRRQLLNYVRLQDAQGFIPGAIWMPGAPASKGGGATWNRGTQGHPPLWVVAVDDYIATGPDDELRAECLAAARRQIAWFEARRRAPAGGFFYNDILLHKWESGVDEGVRFDKTQTGPFACIDATCHVYQLYVYAAKWARESGAADPLLDAGRDTLATFIQQELYDTEGGYFFDSWAIADASLRAVSFEGLWPLITGAATPEQAKRLMKDFVANPDVFFTAHPISTVGVKDPRFELRMWRGPAWNSMTYWVARGCARYGQPELARALLERALDDTAAQFKATGVLWEYYHPQGLDPRVLTRKPATARNQPWPDYLGHNPLFAMALLYDALKPR